VVDREVPFGGGDRPTEAVARDRLEGRTAVGGVGRVPVELEWRPAGDSQALRAEPVLDGRNRFEVGGNRQAAGPADNIRVRQGNGHRRRGGFGDRLPRGWAGGITGRQDQDGGD